MELTIKYTGRNIGFFTVGGDKAGAQSLRVSEHKIRAIREAGGPRLNVIANKVAAILEGHIWPESTNVWVEQHNVRLLACPAVV